MIKAEMYSWDNPGRHGAVQWISVEDLIVDHAYQRDEVSDKNTLSIARNFNWSAFGTLTIMRRKDGTLVVVDGQQRLLASKRRGDIKKVPCVVFDSEGTVGEARAFLAHNTANRPVSAVCKFKAAVLAGRDPEREINRWICAHGLRIADGGKETGVVDFPSLLTVLWKVDKEASMAAIDIQRTIAGTDSLNGYIHKGLWWLLHFGVPVGEHVEKLTRLGGKIAMLKEINATAIMTGKDGRSVATCGMGILSLINYKKHSKITVSPK